MNKKTKIIIFSCFGGFLLGLYLLFSTIIKHNQQVHYEKSQREVSLEKYKELGKASDYFKSVIRSNYDLLTPKFKSNVDLVNFIDKSKKMFNIEPAPSSLLAQTYNDKYKPEINFLYLHNFFSFEDSNNVLRKDIITLRKKSLHNLHILLVEYISNYKDIYDELLLITEDEYVNFGEYKEFRNKYYNLFYDSRKINKEIENLFLEENKNNIIDSINQKL